MSVLNNQLTELTKEDLQTSFETLLRDHQDLVFRYCVQRLGEFHGEEVAQEVFVAAWQGLNKFEYRATVGTWLLGIAKNKCMQVLRNHNRRREILQVSEEEIRTHLHPEPSDPLEEKIRIVDSHDRRNQLVQSLRGLKEEERLIVNLRYTKGIAVGEIAELLGRSEAAIRKRLLRTLQRLREAMNDGTK